MKDKYDNIPMSDEAKEAMSLNSSDQQWIKRLFDRQDEVMGRIIEAMTKVISEKFNEQTSVLLLIQEDIVKIHKILADHEKRIKPLEERLEPIFKEYNENHQKIA